VERSEQAAGTRQDLSAIEIVVLQEPAPDREMPTQELWPIQQHLQWSVGPAQEDLVPRLQTLVERTTQ
jgi:hypothetical protein